MRWGYATKFAIMKLFCHFFAGEFNFLQLHGTAHDSHWVNFMPEGKSQFDVLIRAIFSVFFGFILVARFLRLFLFYFFVIK